MKSTIPFVVIIALAVNTTSWGQNLLADPGFETNGTWTAFGHAGYQVWSRRSGTNGFALFGWDPLAIGGCWQNVPLMIDPMGLGTYTFAVYIRCESNFNPSLLQLKLEGYGLDGFTKTEEDGIANWTHIPRDGFWHHLFVTKAYTNRSTAILRPVIYSKWNGSNVGHEALMIDDASLYVGTYTGSPEVLNTGFEIGNGQWRGIYWAAYPEDDWEVNNWANRSGTNGLVCIGWEPEASGRVRRISQPVTGVSTGEYTFSVWMHREPDFVLNNAALKLEFFDITLTNKAQDDVVTNLSVANDSWWTKFYVVGTVTSPAVYEMRPVLELNWDRTTSGISRALRIDDFRFFQGTHDGYGVRTEWGYYSAVGEDPRIERVPGTNVGTFLQVNYNSHTNIFYLLADSPNLATHRDLGDIGHAGVRTAWQRPETGDWVEFNTPGEKIGQIVLTNGQFRGYPTVNRATVDLWRVSVPHPTTTNGGFYTNSLYVFYSPYFKATNQGVDTELKFLVARNGDRTNALGQVYNDRFWARDYGMWLVPLLVQDAFTNGGFENPSGTNTTFDQTGWVGLGAIGREQWANRSGNAGAGIHSWDPGWCMLYQDVATAGGAVEFSFWIKVQRGAHPTLLEARIEWFDNNGNILRVNRSDLMWLAHYDAWTKVAVLGECNDADVARVRYVIESAFEDGTEPYNEGILIDDANVNDVRASLENGDFSIGPQNSPEAWYVQPGGDIAGLEPWAARSAPMGFAFYGWATNRNTYDIRLMQPIGVSQTGTYVFSIWAKAEQNFRFSNAALRLAWFDVNYSNKVQNDTVQNIILPLDAQWYEYAVTGTCNHTALRFIEVSFEIKFGHGDPLLPSQAAMVDDAALSYTNVSSDSTDGIPNWWLQQYGLGMTNGVGAGDDDGDGANNWDEYAADTNPTNSNSRFQGLQFVHAAGSLGLLGALTSTNSRYYFLEYKTNLLDSSPWLAYGAELQGSGSGTGVVFVTTNDAPQRFYRMGAKP